MTASDDAEWFAQLGASMGETLARRPDLTPAELGARLARIMGEELGADPERIEGAEAAARERFSKIDRRTFLRMAAKRPARNDARGSDR